MVFPGTGSNTRYRSWAAVRTASTGSNKKKAGKSGDAPVNERSSSLGRLLSTLSTRTRSITSSFKTECTAESQRSDGDYLFCPLGSTHEPACPKTVGGSSNDGVDASPLMAPKVLSDLASSSTPASRKAAFDEFLKSQGIEAKPQHVSSGRDMNRRICKEGSELASQVPGQNYSHSERQNNGYKEPDPFNAEPDQRNSYNGPETIMCQVRGESALNPPETHLRSSSVPRRPSLSSVSTLSMSSSHHKKQRRSRSHSRPKYPWIRVPSFSRSRSRKPTKPDAVAVRVDHEGRCPNHPLIQLKRQSTGSGEWRTLLRSCPSCIGENDSGGTILDCLRAPPEFTNKQQKARHRSRSYSISKRQRSTHLNKGEVRLRCRSASRTSRCPVDTDDYVDGVLRCAREEEDTSNADNGPMIWASSQRMEDGDKSKGDGYDSTDDLSEALAMIEDVQSENASLHQSMLEATQLAQRMAEKLAHLVRVHDETVRSYEEKLTSLKCPREKAEPQHLPRMDRVREESEVLRAALLKGDKEERGLSDLIKKKEMAHRKDAERVDRERGTLKQEICILRGALEKSLGSGEESI